MQLRRLVVKNIRSYSTADLKIGPGTTLISGDVGSGKTSLLYAIEMALFGFAEVDATYLVRHRAARAEVALTLEDVDHHYELRRSFRRKLRKGRDSFELEESSFAVDGVRRTYSATELRQRVIELLGFPDNPNPRAHSDLWRWAVYVPQERMREVLAQDAQERLETVRKALGIERYRTAAENALIVASELRRRAEVRDAEAERLRHWEDDLPRWGFERLGAVEEASGLRRAEEILRTDIGRIEQELNELGEQLRRSEGDRRESEQLRQQSGIDEASVIERGDLIIRKSAESERLRADAAEVIQRASAGAKERERLSTDREERERLRGRLRELEEDRRALSAAESGLASARAQEHQASTQRDLDADEALAMNETLERLLRDGLVHEPSAPTRRELPQIEDELVLLRTDEAKSLGRVTELRTELGELNELLRLGICPRCHQKVEAETFATHQLEAKAALKEGEEHHQRMVARRETLETERRSRERFDRAHERWVEVEKHRETARESRRIADQRLKSTEAALIAAGDAARLAEKRFATLRPAVELYQTSQVALESVERSLASRELSITESERQAEQARTWRETAARVDAEVERLTEERNELTTRLDQRRSRISELDSRLFRHGEVEKQIRETQRRLGSAREEVEGVSRRIAKAEARKEEAERRTQEAETGRRERAELIAEGARLTSMAAWFSSPFHDALLVMEQQLLAQAQHAFESNFSRFFSALLDDPSIVARTDVAFSPAVEINGEWTPPEALSGGERTSLALAFRLALGQVVRSLGHLRLETILLDEPTDGFSPEQVVRMGELLEELGLPQVVLVSHEGQLGAIADREVRVRKVDGLSVLEEGASAGPSPTAAVSPREERQPKRLAPRRRRRPTLDRILPAE